MTTLANYTRVGQIVGTFGLKGIVKVQALTDFYDRFAPGSKLRLNENWVEVETFTIHKNRPLIKLKGIGNISAAEALKWAYLEIPAEDRPKLDEGEFLTADLIGLVVTTVEGRLLGPVDEVVQMPAHDVIRIGELLIPAVLEFVKDIDLNAGTMTVQLIPGMLDDD